MFKKFLHISPQHLCESHTQLPKTTYRDKVWLFICQAKARKYFWGNLLWKRNQCFLFAFLFVPKLYPGTKVIVRYYTGHSCSLAFTPPVLSVRTLVWWVKKWWCSACTMRTTRNEKTIADVSVVFQSCHWHHNVITSLRHLLNLKIGQSLEVNSLGSPKCFLSARQSTSFGIAIGTVQNSGYTVKVKENIGGFTVLAVR